MRSGRLRLHVGASKLHRWLALIIGVQLLLWFSSGLLMSILPIERVRGEYLVARESTTMLGSAQEFASPASVLGAAPGPVLELRYTTLLGQPVAELTMANGTVRMHDARSGLPMPRIDAPFAMRVARAAYRGPGAPVASVVLARTRSTEFRGKLPVWRVQFEDAETTRVFVSPENGRIVGVRTGTWRLYDFFWGLHIMDWKNHEDFNTPWMMAFAAGGLALAVAGVVLLYMRWPRRKQRKIQGVRNVAA
ncbi:PepSY domain-containing protein [Sphingomonas sp. Leaf28]|uniref:PepSY domain-containing protein n=1 Tax=Sphingomonas sp. Leaf28 TaxID=1735695 RepID=UPI002286BEA3|nr:PepSY domain-containing protein [Sphingomonas sp. Leaf28]